MQSSSNISFYKLGKKGGKGGRVLGICRVSALPMRSLGKVSQLMASGSYTA